jgi:hypothetical protein
MNETTKTEERNALTTNDTAANILTAAQEEAGFDKLLKFRKGDYAIGKEAVPLGTEYLAHAAAWTKTWLKFVDGKIADRKIYRVARGERPPEREELDDWPNGENGKWWPTSNDGQPSDPWSYQYLLPLENMVTGELVIFTTGTVGGRRAVADLCKAYGNREKNGRGGQPVVRLAAVDMPTKYGNQPRPLFEIVGWDDAVPDEAAVEELAAAIPVQPTQHTAAAAKRSSDMDDEIPF